MKTAKLPCGCRYEVAERERWTDLCEKHQAEFDETHARWAAEHRAQQAEQKEARHA